MRGGSNAKIRKGGPAPAVAKPAELPYRVPTIEEPEALPASLSRLYYEILGVLKGRGLQTVDTEQIRTYCTLVLVQRLAEADIVERGLWIDTLNGERPNPSIRTLRDASAQSLRIAEQYGLTVGSRLRLGLQMETGGLSPLEQLNAELHAITSARMAKYEDEIEEE